jgi:hypothetical protein
MASVKCLDCGTDVSDLAKSCPRCARPVAVVTHPEGPFVDLKTTVAVGVLLAAIALEWLNRGFGPFTAVETVLIAAGAILVNTKRGMGFLQALNNGARKDGAAPEEGAPVPKDTRGDHSGDSPGTAVGLSSSSTTQPFP